MVVYHKNEMGQRIILDEYPPKFDDKLKNAIRERDRWTCAICGDPGVHVHHINYIKADCHEMNLITLCESCHPMTNGNRGEWRRILTAKVATRERIPHIERRTRSMHGRRQTKEVLYAQQKEYRYRLRVRDTIRWIRHSGVSTYSAIPDEKWMAFRTRLRRKGMSYIAVPNENGLIVITELGKTELPKDERNLHSLVRSWVRNTPDGKKIGRSRCVAEFLRGNHD